jgi:hypothetical protein
MDARPHPGVDSLAPAHSALRAFVLRPNSFRRFPNGSSLPQEKGKRAPLLVAKLRWVARIQPPLAARTEGTPYLGRLAGTLVQPNPSESNQIRPNPTRLRYSFGAARSFRTGTIKPNQGKSNRKNGTREEAKESSIGATSYAAPDGAKIHGRWFSTRMPRLRRSLRRATTKLRGQSQSNIVRVGAFGDRIQNFSISHYK